MDNLALLISYVESERDSAENSQAQSTKKQRWKNPKVWLKVIGFCLSLFTVCLSAGVAEAATAPVNARNGLNVHTEQSTSYPTVYGLRHGQTVNTAGGGTGGGRPSIARIQSVSGVSLRSGPSTSHKVVSSLSSGQIVKTSGRRSGKWVQLANGYWVHGNYLTFGRSSGGGTGGGYRLIKTVHSYTYGANVRSGPGTGYHKVNYFRNGTRVSVTGRVAHGWYQLTRGRGWIAGNLLRSGAAAGGGAPCRCARFRFIKTIHSHTHGANVRNGPGTGYHKVNYFYNGTRVSVTGRVVHGWYQLTRGRGWIAGNLLQG